MSRECLTRWMSGDVSAGFQDVAGDGEFVGRCAEVAQRVMQDEVLELHEFAVDQKRGIRVEEMRAREKSLANRRAGNALGEPRERGAC